jgi:hypothetical protein
MARVELVMSRRNLTPEQLSYMRGKEYLATVGNAKDNLIPGAVHNPSKSKSCPSKNGDTAAQGATHL